MSKELAKFEDWPYRVPDIDKALKKYDLIIASLRNASSGEEAYKAFKAMAKMNDKIEDEITHVQVLFSLETNNSKYKKGMKILNEKIPYLSKVSTDFAKEMLNSPHREYLEKKIGSHYFTMAEYMFKSFDEKIIEEAQIDADLTMQYDELMASIRVEFEGQEYNLPQMGKFLVDPSRERREKAFYARTKAVLEKKEAIEDIYDKMVKNRTIMAKKMGYESYTDMAYIVMSRYDYDKKMVASYREQIKEVVTPLAEKLIEEQRKRLGLKRMKLFDLNLVFLEGNATPKGTTEEKVEMAKKMYDALSPETSYFFRFMDEHHLMFLDAKPGKQGGGYMTYFPVHKCPIIFSNFNGTAGDVDVLTHEFGHSFQAYLGSSIKVSEYRNPTLESCEIHSMSMEFFAEPYMDLFFDSPDKYRYQHLADSIEFLPYGVTVDEFQEWVYDHPEASKEERDEKWRALEEKYTPYKVRAVIGDEIASSCPRYLIQAHIFDSPFYYIDYTLAQVCAFQFFNMDRKNHEKAWKHYMKLCKMGGKYPFVELITKAGLKNPFEDGVLKKTIAPLVKQLKTYKID